MIENGYVNGANGKLNPKTSITRAEFAKVISEMASTYADADDSLSATVDGSVIVRENGVSCPARPSTATSSLQTASAEST